MKILLVGAGGYALEHIKAIQKLSTTDIGKHFNKDHTSVIHNIKKIKNIIKTNETEKKIIDDIIKNVKS